MRATFPKKAPVLLLASVLMIGASASAATIYDNSVHDSNLRFAATNEIGDEIIFAGSERVLTNFSFEYWALNNGTTNAGGFSATASARVRFYLNDGPLFNGYASPGTKFYDSGSFLIGAPTDRATFVFTAGADFPAGGLVMPVVSNMTWTVQFSGLDADDSAGLDVYYPPVVGTSPAELNNRRDDYWDFGSGSPVLKTNIVDISFGARFEAVPEPSTVVFGVLGGLGLLVLGRRFIKVSK